MLDYYAEDIGISKELFTNMGSLLGAGLNSANICGAVSAAYLILGVKYGSNKKIVKEKMKEFNEEFLYLNSSKECKELLGEDVTLPGIREKLVENGIKDKVCPRAVSTSINILKKL
ncbi:C-GCAxxG-C-C family protein [Miniphocaeibacter massiliensis]|uniref:C-GCAxxG-C-C family protein n=1 Tax=Miniphocaeibacter massiliensis TaxID=2041841 RepID=UPI000C1C7D33|nr:C-GCAxxG-C-C family protein [Miniphocaeibacter massiliensis]